MVLMTPAAPLTTPLLKGAIGMASSNLNRVCEHCGNAYVPKSSSRQRRFRFCSRQCAGAHTRTHGRHRTPEHRVWANAKYRCDNPRSRQWANYGGRGIRMCERWRESFEAFLLDVGPRPSGGHSLDRIDNSGNYEPGNVRWATATEQRNNTRCNRPMTLGGVTRNLAEWAKAVGIKRSTLDMRVRSGWRDEAALSIPVEKRTKRS